MRSDRGLVLALMLSAAAPAAAEPLVGLGVGNADLLVAEGTRLYNEKDYPAARDHFLKATRVAPATLPTYLSLARAYFALLDLDYSCQAYRVYVKSSPESPDRAKAQSELELCERQRVEKASTGPQLSQIYVNMRATFFDALDKGELLGAGSAHETFQGMLNAAYAAPDVGDMAQKLGKAAEQSADKVFRAALSHQKPAPVDLRKASALYSLAIDCGVTPGAMTAHAAFVEGVAFLAEGQAAQAEASFADAAKRDPADVEARFWRGLAKYIGGDKPGGLKALEADLPADPRTGVVRVAAAFDKGPDPATGELVKFLFARRFKGDAR
jgi:tetratricopeptide (TPR) repeat protein